MKTNTKQYFILSLIILLGTFYITSLFIAVGDGSYFPYDEDETIFYSSAKLFYETLSVRASSTISEEVSPKLSTGWYGPFYHIFYGTISKLFGFHHGLIFIWINFLCLLLALLIFYNTIPNKKYKLFGILLFFSSPTLLIYSFTYFPEVIHILFSTILIFLLYKIYVLFRNNLNNYKKILFYYISFVILFSLFRITFIFWLAGIIPFYKNKKELFYNILYFLINFIFILIYMKYFTAPPFANTMKAISLLINFEILQFLTTITNQFIENIKILFLFSINSLSNYILLFSSLFIIFINFYKKNKFLHSISLIISLYYIIFLCLYNTNPYFFSKQTITLYPLIIFYIIVYTKKETIVMIFTSILVLLPQTINTTVQNIIMRKESYVNFSQNYHDMVSSFQKISGAVNQHKESIILWDYAEYDYPNKAIEAIIPLSNKNSYPITYTTNITKKTSPDFIRFKTHNKLKIDYILSKNKLDNGHLKLILKTKYFNFYKKETK